MPPHSPPSLKALACLLQNDMEQVNELIFSCLESRIALIPEIAQYLMTSGGKRLRPMLALASAHLCGHQGSKPVKLGACVEFIHAATLLHDDVVDNSSMRRGLAAAHTVWGTRASVLVGDFLLSRAFHLMMELENAEAMRVLCQTACQIAEGEILQLTLHRKLDVPPAEYIQMIAAKTARLFQSACEIGAILDPEDTPDKAHNREALKRYGMNLGIAFQLMDDHLDYTAREETFGKPLYQDLHERKVTLPVLLAYAQGGTQEQTFWRRLFEDTTLPLSQKDVEHALHLLHATKSLDQNQKLAKSYGCAAISDLTPFPESPLRDALAETAAFSMGRSM